MKYVFFSMLLAAISACCHRTSLSYGAPDYRIGGLRFHEMAPWRTDPEAVHKVVQDTIKIWEAALERHGMSCDVRCALDFDVLIMSAVTLNGESVAGVAHTGRDRYVEVKILEGGAIMKTDNGSSALAHELGHMIEKTCAGHTSNESLFIWHKHDGVPY